MKKKIKPLKKQYSELEPELAKAKAANTSAEFSMTGDQVSEYNTLKAEASKQTHKVRLRQGP